MSSKRLAGAVVAAASVCGVTWKVAGGRTDSAALAAPEEPRLSAAESLGRALDARTESRVARAPVPQETAPAPLAQRAIAGLIEDLRDDDVKGNARRAVEELGRAGPEVVLPLQRALRSNDFQQRQFAAQLLACRADAPVTQTLADALVEGLGDVVEQHPSVDLYTGYDLSGICRDLLSTRPALFQLALPRLARLLDTAGPWLRFQVARVCAAQRSEVARERTLAVLLEHLEDNDDDKDARIALPAIAGYGAAALPVLQRAWPGRDEQQRALLGHLIWLCAPASPCARELTPAGFHALGFVPWKPPPLEPAPPASPP